MPSRLDWIQQEIDGLKEAGLYNRIRTISSPQGAWLVVDGTARAQFLLEQLPGPGQSAAHGREAARGAGQIRLRPGARCAPSPARSTCTWSWSAAWRPSRASKPPSPSSPASPPTWRRLPPWWAKRMSSSRTSSTTPASSTAAACRARASCATRTATRPTWRPGSRKTRADYRRALIDHRRRLQHGRRHRPAGQDLRGRRGLRCDADGGRRPRRGRARPRRARHRRSLRPARQGRCGGRHAVQGLRRGGRRGGRQPAGGRVAAPARPALPLLVGSHRRRCRRLPGGRGPARRVRPSWSTGCGPTRAYFKEEMAALGFDTGVSATPITPVMLGRGAPGPAVQPRAVRRRRLRHGHRLPHRAARARRASA